MKYFYHTAAAICLLIAVQRSYSQKLAFNLGAKDCEVTAVSANVRTSPECTFDRGLGWLVVGDGYSEHDVSYDRENCIQALSKYRGHSSDDAGLDETAKQAIIIDLKVPIFDFDIVGLNVEQKSNGYLFRIHCTKQLPVLESWLTPIGDDTWLYITLADAQADVAVLEDFKLTAFVKQIYIFQSETSVQITFMIKGHVDNASLIPMEGSQDILVAVFMPTDEQLAINKAR